MATGEYTEQPVVPPRWNVATVPNAVTLVRLACIPLFLYVLFGRDNRVAAGLLLGGLGATDWVDGFIARRYNQVSELGKMLDPTADRLLFIVGIGGIIIDGAAPPWFAWLVLVREALLGSAVAALTLAGMKRFDVTFLGKAATLMLMVAFPAFMLGSSDLASRWVFQVIGWGFGIPGLVVSYYTAVTYVPTLRAKFREGRGERAP